ncbi:MAG TPA: shikimate dehydrogenase [Salinisphaeraceae bacterium]|nr:shikimate dehydrogenase [Salinisphaeraceae bacterium]
MTQTMPGHKPDEYAVIGNPVAHSRSPEIHAAFARQTHQAISYQRLPCELDAFAMTVQAFFERGGMGLNVTLPFKQQAAAFADHVSARAQAAGAVNTLLRQTDGTIAGDNTDGIGLVRDVGTNLQLALAGTRVLILGAGGAVRGVCAPLLASSPATLVIANRTVAKAQAIATLFDQQGPITASSLPDMAQLGPFDLVINAISAGLQGDMPELPAGLFAANAAAYDMIYADQPTPFLRWAAAQDVAQRRDGFGMLVEQAAESFHLWRGVRPHTQPVIAQLRPGAA